MPKLSSQDLLEQLRWRYATKQFDPKKTIPADTWTALEESLVLTPSSFGLQPWHFIVVTDQSTKENLLPHSWNQTQVTECSHFIILAARTDIDDTAIQQFIDRVAEVRKVDTDSLEGYQNMMSGFISHMDDDQKLQWAKLQTYIALGQLMTSAAVLGIDACPMEGIDPAKYDEVLGLPAKGLATSVACALGYRSAEDKYAETPKVRFTSDSIISSF